MASITETIQRRYSCRSFSKRPIDETVLQTFRQFVDAPPKGLFGNAPRFTLIAMDNLPRDEWKKLGTYGVIKNARLYLVGMISPAPLATCDYGYCKEKLILKATGLGLATCWLGGTFAISAFGRAAGMRRNELLPTVSPVGYEADHKSLTEKVIRRFAGSDHRLPWKDLFFNGNAQTPLTPGEAGVYSQALENVRLAPSASNKQPWRILYQKDINRLSFYLFRATGYKYLRNISLQEIDMGIALCHFDLTVRELGFAGRWLGGDETPSAPPWEPVACWQGGA